MKNAILATAVATMVVGCATSTVTGYRDPDFKQYDSVAVLAYGMSGEMAQLVENAACEAVAPTRCQRAQELLPPTREWSKEQSKAKLAAAGVGAILLIGGATDNSNSGVAGFTTLPGSSTTSGNVSAYGNTAYYNQTTTTNPGITLPIYYANRAAASNIVLVDVEQDRSVYVGQVATKGQGMANTGDGTFARSAAKKLAAELRAKGLIQ